MIIGDKYYIHISIENLPHYFSSGYFAPVSFYENRNLDIQTHFDGAILFSKQKWHEHDDCSIECFLPDELEKYDIDDNYFLVNGFLPLSRVSKIYYCDKALMDNVVWSINETTAFIPQRLLCFEEKVNSISLKNTKKIEVLPFTELLKQVENYNRIMGAFAFSKTLRLNYFDGRLTYSDSFLSLLSSLLNNKIGELSIENSMIFTDLFSSKSKSIWTELKKLLVHEINNQYVAEFAKTNNLKINERFNLISLDQFKGRTHIYCMIILATYGEGRAKSIDDFISDAEINKISGNDLIYSTILLGLYTGYKKLRHVYSLAKVNIPVKFELKNRIDYFVMEAVYNFVMGKPADIDSDYINVFSIPEPEKNIIDNEKYFGKYFCGTNIITYADFEYMSKEYRENVYSSIFKNHSNLISEFIDTNSKLLGITGDSKLIPFSNLTYRLIEGFVTIIIEKASSDYELLDRNKNMLQENELKNISDAKLPQENKSNSAKGRNVKKTAVKSLKKKKSSKDSDLEKGSQSKLF